MNQTNKADRRAATCLMRWSVGSDCLIDNVKFGMNRECSY